MRNILNKFNISYIGCPGRMRRHLQEGHTYLITKKVLDKNPVHTSANVLVDYNQSTLEQNDNVGFRRNIYTLLIIFASFSLIFIFCYIYSDYCYCLEGYNHDLPRRFTGDGANIEIFKESGNLKVRGTILNGKLEYFHNFRLDRVFYSDGCINYSYCIPYRVQHAYIITEDCFSANPANGKFTLSVVGSGYGGDLKFQLQGNSVKFVHETRGFFHLIRA